MGDCEADERILKRGMNMKRRRLERERQEKKRLRKEEARRAAEEQAREEIRKIRRRENWVMAGSVAGCLLMAVVMNMCFGADVSYGGHRGWAGGHQDARLGMALIFGPCVGGVICRIMRKIQKKNR